MWRLFFTELVWASNQDDPWVMYLGHVEPGGDPGADPAHACHVCPLAWNTFVARERKKQPFLLWKHMAIHLEEQF